MIYNEVTPKNNSVRGVTHPVTRHGPFLMVIYVINRSSQLRLLQLYTTANGNIRRAWESGRKFN